MILASQLELLKDTLADLSNQAFLGINYPGYQGFINARKLLLSFFNGGLDRAIEVVDALNFDDAVESHVIRYIPDIIESMNSLEDQLAFIAHMKDIQEQHPNVNFGSALFYAQMNLNFDDEKINSTIID